MLHTFETISPIKKLNANDVTIGTCVYRPRHFATTMPARDINDSITFPSDDKLLLIIFHEQTLIHLAVTCNDWKEFTSKEPKKEQIDRIQS